MDRDGSSGRWRRVLLGVLLLALSCATVLVGSLEFLPRDACHGHALLAYVEIVVAFVGVGVALRAVLLARSGDGFGSWCLPALGIDALWVILIWKLSGGRC